MIQSEKGKKKLQKVKMAAKSRREKEKAMLCQEDVVIDPISNNQDGVLFIMAKDLHLERKLVKSLAEHIEDNEFREMNKMIRKKLRKWSKTPLKIGVLGQSRSGKSSLIEALLGKNANMEYRYMEHSLKTQEYTSPLNANLTVTEISLPESNTMRDKFLKEMHLSQFDFVILATSTWFTETSMWITSCLKKLAIRIIFVRTKIDETLEIEQQQNSKSCTTDNILSKVRGHCESTLKMTYSPECCVHLVSARFTSNWDGNSFVNDIMKNAEKSGIAMSLNPMAPDLLSIKYQLLNERIWKVAVMSVSSGIMTVPGFSIVADIELLRTEVGFYFQQLGIDNSVLQDFDITGDLVSVWTLILDGVGLVSLLKQAALDQKEEEFSKFMKWLPLIGGNVSFAATCSVLSFVLMELFTIANRTLDRNSLLPGENIPPRCQTVVIETAPKDFETVYL